MNTIPFEYQTQFNNPNIELSGSVFWKIIQILSMCSFSLSRRASSASAKATALAAAVTTLSNATGKLLTDPDVIVSYSAFQAEAAINR
jgi:hypothetical protein